MAEITLKASTGRKLGSGPAKQLRAEGLIPGVVYGLDADPIPVTVEWKPLREVLTTDAGLNVLIDLDIDGKVDMCVVKELQRHAIRGNVMHIDFLRVSADAEISVDIPIILHGEAKAVTGQGGTVDHLLHALHISAKPADIPNEIVVDISGLELHGAIRVGDLSLPAGVTIGVDPEDAVVVGTPGAAQAPEDGEAGDGGAAVAAGEAAAEEPAAEAGEDAAAGAGDDSGDAEG